MRWTVKASISSRSGACSERQQSTATSLPRSASPPANVSVNRSIPPMCGRKLALTRRTLTSDGRIDTCAAEEIFHAPDDGVAVLAGHPPEALAAAFHGVDETANDLVVAVPKAPTDDSCPRRGDAGHVAGHHARGAAEDLPRAVRPVVRHDDEHVTKDVERSDRKRSDDDKMPFREGRAEAHRERRPDGLVLERRHEIANLRAISPGVDAARL